MSKDRYTIRENAYKRKYIPYNDDDDDEDPICRTINLFNSNLSSWKYGFEKDPDQDITIAKFLDITKDLSSILTDISDKSLFEIDDVLYGDLVQSRENSCSSKSKYLDCLAMEDYNKCYKMIIEKGYSNHELDTFSLRLAENVGGIHFEWIFYELGWSRDERKICLFLKIFKACLKVEDDIALFIIEEFADEIDFPFFLLKLQQFPQPSDSKNKRIVEFIIKQADDCLDALNVTEMLEEPKKFIEDSIEHFWKDDDYDWSPHYQYILLDVFMLAKNMNERKEFLKVFLEALRKSCEGKRPIYHEFRMTFVSVSKYLISIAENIVKDKCCEEDMRYIDQHCGYNIGTYWSDKSPEDAKAHHESEIVYVDEEETCSSPLVMAGGIQDFFENRGYFADLEFHGHAKKPQDINESLYKSFNKSDVNSFSEESDIDSQKHHSVKSYFKNLKAKDITDLKDEYIFKKFLIYDDFMKCLHLMSILHTAITEYTVLFKESLSFEYPVQEWSKFCFMHERHMLCPDLNKEDEPLSFEKVVHEGSEFCFMHEQDMLCSDLKNKKVSWPLEMAVTKCPFLYLNKTACHLNMEYLKDLKGEQIDEAAEKEIFGYIRKDEAARLKNI